MGNMGEPRKAPKVGDVLISKPIGNAARRYKGDSATKSTEIIVTRVGRKYFYTGNGWQENKYYIKTWKHASDRPTSQLYANTQEIEDEAEHLNIRKELCEIFRYTHDVSRRFTLAQLRGILAATQPEGEAEASLTLAESWQRRWGQYWTGR